MSDFDEKTGKAFPGKVLLSPTASGRIGMEDMQVFEQTPSHGAYGYVASEAAAVPPHQLFHLFTAAIIIEKKVFVR